MVPEDIHTVTTHETLNPRKSGDAQFTHYCGESST